MPWAARVCPKGVEANPDTCTFPAVNTETEYGWDKKVKMKVPIFTGALGSTEIARKNWEHFAVGAAIGGVTLVCGENVCGIDPELELDANRQGRNWRPDMDRRIETYKQYHRGYGEILVQMNVEDTRLGVAEYVIEKHGLETIELKWGQGAKCIGGEIKVNSLERALELQKRGYIVTPDPSEPGEPGGLSRTAPSRSSSATAASVSSSEEASWTRCERLRKLWVQAHHAQDRRLRPARAGYGDQVGLKGQDRSADDRRRSRRHRHEPLADDGGVGHSEHLPAFGGL